MTTKRFLQVAAAVVFGSAPPIPITNLDGDGLTIDWEITKPRSGADSGSITIYNMGEAQRGVLHGAFKAATGKVPDSVVNGYAGQYIHQAGGDLAIARVLARRALQAPYGYPVRLAIGWERVPSVVYTGDVIRLDPSKRSGPDVMTIAEVGSRAVEDAAFGASFAEVTAGVIVKFLVQSPAPTGFGMILDPLSEAKIQERAAAIGWTTVRSWARCGSTKEVLIEILATCGLEYRILGGKRFVVTDQGDLGALLASAHVLNPMTGLLEWTETDDGGLDVQALALPELSPGDAVLVQDARGKPVGGALRYRVDSVQFSGSTRGYSTMALACRQIGVGL